ncbi:MAG TPA: succinate dehydrogenase, cytochrome b556 subunit [Coxiellaceae bacterium]|nr:succinate dehydrogenase, cytochrome b556 subunit [Coxiellaceae bacterium]
MKSVSSDTRPTNRNVFQYRFPLTAIISILHRVSGVALFLAMPLFLCALSSSLASAEQFQSLQTTLQQIHIKFLVWVILAALSFHWVAGVRHMIMDLGFAESLRAGQMGAMLTLIFSIVLMVMAGVWLW